MAPGDHVADWAGYAPEPEASGRAVTGRSYASRERPTRSTILGGEGVSITDEDVAVTVRFAECAMMLCWPDGGRQLFGNDGLAMRVEPTLYRDLPAAIPWLDAHVPPHLRVSLPARDPQHIPRPGKAPGPLATALRSLAPGRGR
ncbi:hypothetical protein [Actinoplanes sp. NPDC051411]|uniref:hypothetical protein n=1 Tax=Actinoplanes sp. NPDC051411 TaxID=3155522 RepID=UPI003428FE5A